MVDLAISSLALSVFSRTKQHPPAAIEASSRYYRLLRVTREQIAQLEISRFDVRKIDACLLVASLMGRYEGANHRPGDFGSMKSLTSGQSWPHHEGAMAILKVWYDNMNHNTTTFIVKHTRRNLIRSSLLRDLPLPAWLQNGYNFGENGLELDYDRIIVRMVNLHRVCVSLRQQKNGLQPAQIRDLNSEACQLDNALQDWAAQIPSNCSYQRKIIPKHGNWPRKHFYSSIVYTFPGPGYASAWSQYFAMRMLISSTRLKILKLSHSTSLNDLIYERQRLDCITELKTLADHLASSIPFCLERFKVDDSSRLQGQSSITLTTNDDIKPYLATMVVWPLTIASSVTGIDVKQQLWFRSELARLGRVTGDGILEFAETDQWAIL